MKDTPSLAVKINISRRDCLASLDSLKNLTYDNLYVMLNPKLKDSEIRKKLDSMKALVYLQEEHQDPSTYAYGGFELLDLITEDWVVSLDDDDLLLYDYSKIIKNIKEDIGLIYGNDYVRYEIGEDLQKRITSEITKIEEVIKVKTGCWCIRTRAWKSISPHLTKRMHWWSDFRIFAYLFKQGWKFKHINEFVSITLTSSIHYQGKKIPSWDEELKEIKRLTLPREGCIC